MWRVSTSYPRHHPVFREIGGAICEVNAAPGFRMHVAPTEGTHEMSQNP